MCPNSWFSKQSDHTLCLRGLNSWQTFPSCWSQNMPAFWFPLKELTSTSPSCGMVVGSWWHVSPGPGGPWCWPGKSSRGECLEVLLRVPNKGQTGGELRQDQAQSPGLPFLVSLLLCSVPSSFLVKFLQLSGGPNTLELVDVGSGVWESNDALHQGNICNLYNLTQCRNPKAVSIWLPWHNFFPPNAFQGTFCLFF